MGGGAGCVSGGDKVKKAVPESCLSLSPRCLYLRDSLGAVARLSWGGSALIGGPLVVVDVFCFF